MTENKGRPDFSRRRPDDTSGNSHHEVDPFGGGYPPLPGIDRPTIPTMPGNFSRDTDATDPDLRLLRPKGPDIAPPLGGDKHPYNLKPVHTKTSALTDEQRANFIGEAQPKGVGKNGKVAGPDAIVPQSYYDAINNIRNGSALSEFRGGTPVPYEPRVGGVTNGKDRVPALTQEQRDTPKRDVRVDGESSYPFPDTAFVGPKYGETLKTIDGENPFPKIITKRVEPLTHAIENLGERMADSRIVEVVGNRVDATGEVIGEVVNGVKAIHSLKTTEGRAAAKEALHDYAVEFGANTKGEWEETKDVLGNAFDKVDHKLRGQVVEDPTTGEKRKVKGVLEKSRHAITGYKEKAFDPITGELVVVKEIDPKTGKPHDKRVPGIPEKVVGNYLADAIHNRSGERPAAIATAAVVALGALGIHSIVEAREETPEKSTHSLNGPAKPGAEDGSNIDAIDQTGRLCDIQGFSGGEFVCATDDGELRGTVRSLYGTDTNGDGIGRTVASGEINDDEYTGSGESEIGVGEAFTFDVERDPNVTDNYTVQVMKNPEGADPYTVTVVDNTPSGGQG